jgi:hypothetical protein
MQPEIQIRGGKRIRIWCGWYRIDSIFVDGKQLCGHIQIRSSYGRIDALTRYKDEGVLGSDVEWLLRKNREEQH